MENSSDDNLQEIEESAHNGDPADQCNFGAHHYENDDFEGAFKWFEKSANQDYALAQYNLSVLYYEGIGVEKSIEVAIDLLEKSTKQGLRVALNCLHNIGEYLRQEVASITSDIGAGNELSDIFAKASSEELAKFQSNLDLQVRVFKIIRKSASQELVNRNSSNSNDNEDTAHLSIGAQ